jgi:hypothetical protein
MADKLTQEVLGRLSEPFRPDQVRWKPQVVTEAGRALAVPYVDPRVVTERLDHVVGGDWAFHWEPLGVQGDRLVIKSSLTVLGVTREDVGEHVLSDREQADPWKSAVSDALKRAAVHFGVGRYLYWLETVWCNYDRRRREFIDEPYIDADGSVQVRRRQPEQAQAAASRPAPQRAGRSAVPGAPGPRQVREPAAAEAYAAPWADEFQTWLARYLSNQGVTEEAPAKVYRRLVELGHVEADLSAYAALSDAQGALIRALPAYQRDKTQSKADDAA